jgi:hypothetical protein
MSIPGSWMNILEPTHNSKKHPTAVNVSWKTDYKRIIASFRVSVIIFRTTR